MSKDEFDAIYRDAIRYRKLREEAMLKDPYDTGASTTSSWNWTISLPTGKSKGTSAPIDTPDFDTIVDQLPEPISYD